MCSIECQNGLLILEVGLCKSDFEVRVNYELCFAFSCSHRAFMIARP